MRNTKEAISIKSVHSKAVSYVRYLESDTILSASTDSTIKSWSFPELGSPNSTQAPKIHQGHKNERNFVGLSINSTRKFFACGSERNEICVYSRFASDVWLNSDFKQTTNNMVKNRNTGGVHFGSAMCWHSLLENVFVCANSEGIIQMYEMV